MRCGSVGRERERESNSYKEYSRWGKEREETSWEMRETKKKERIMKKRSHEKWRDEKKPQKNSESSLKRDKNNP